MRILIVEDDPVLRDRLERALRAEGFVVDIAANGEEAESRFRSEDYELAVCDIGLPGLDGFELLRRVRASGATLPVLLLTARDAIEDRVHGLDLGADDYLVKPFALAELVARIRALLRRGQVRGGNKLVHGPLTLDTLARRASLHDARLELSGREWAVLEYLLSRVERVASKEQIIQSVISWDEELTPNAVEVYVSRLRAKLEPAGVRIRTVRGFGYLLEAWRDGPH
jgi:two-component system OmpR family response regulator